MFVVTILLILNGHNRLNQFLESFKVFLDLFMVLLERIDILFHQFKVSIVLVLIHVNSASIQIENILSFGLGQALKRIFYATLWSQKCLELLRCRNIMQITAPNAELVEEVLSLNCQCLISFMSSGLTSL